MVVDRLLDINGRTQVLSSSFFFYQDDFIRSFDFANLTGCV